MIPGHAPIRRRAATIALTCLVVAGCSAPSPEPTPPQPRPTPTPAAPPVVVQPTYDNWMDAPQRPGNWYYRAEPGGGFAAFGAANSEPLFSMRCDRATRRIVFSRAGRGTGDVAMRIRTESRDRVLTARPSGGQLPTLQVAIAASDPILDAMAFTKGRFALETQGQPTLYVPSWPEVTRVIEDCR